MDYPAKRDRARIYAEILENIRNICLAGERPTITRIQNKVNVPFSRFKEYVDDLQKKRLIYIEAELTLTKQGEEYLKEYRKVREFLEKFGLVKGNDD